MKNKLVAALLALFLGGLGIHKFYLGQIFKGFLYLIFCWTFIPALISFFEAIILLVMSEDNFNKRYNPEMYVPVTSQSAPIAGQTKKCPYCAEEVMLGAIKCKHCGSSITMEEGARV